MDVGDMLVRCWLRVPTQLYGLGCVLYLNNCEKFSSREEELMFNELTYLVGLGAAKLE
jgi:hypothetical protein